MKKLVVNFPPDFLIIRLTGSQMEIISLTGLLQELQLIIILNKLRTSMAEQYYSQLRQILESLYIPKATLECKHFFSGVALYANGRICALLGPAGFAVKLPTDQRQALIDEENGTKFRFFPNGPVKREYVLLSESVIEDEQTLHKILGLCVNYVMEAPD